MQILSIYYCTFKLTLNYFNEQILYKEERLTDLKMVFWIFKYIKVYIRSLDYKSDKAYKRGETIKFKVTKDHKSFFMSITLKDMFSLICDKFGIQINTERQ